MDQAFARFLRRGGQDELTISDQPRVLPRHPIRLTLKRLFPGYDDHRAAFEARLDDVIDENTIMLIQALNPPDSPPNITLAEIPDATPAREGALVAWDENVARIWTEWNTLPQRFTPQRLAMEDTLLRRFSAGLNRARQLFDLPGFRPEQIEAWREEFPAVDPDLLPNTTGEQAPVLPDTGVESFPAAEEQGPFVLEARRQDDFTTPGANVVRTHGSETGDEIHAQWS